MRRISSSHSWRPCRGRRGREATNEVFERYLDPAFVYRFAQGPERVPDEAAARQSGLNCVALAHLVLRDLFDWQLPPELHCYEMVTDTTQFATVAEPDDMRAGDLVWFGVSRPRVPLEQFAPIYDAMGALANWRQNPVKHVAVHTGCREDDHLLLHANNVDGTNAIWPLQRFADYKRYARIYRISRLIIQGGTSEH